MEDITAEEVRGMETDVVAALANNKYALPPIAKKATITIAPSRFFAEYDFSFLICSP